MKITLFIGGLSGGGAERVTCSLANFLVERNYETEILTMADDVPTYSLDSNVKRKVLLKTKERKFFLYNSMLRLYRFYKYLHRTESDVIIVMLPETTIMLLRMKAFTKAKVIAAERSLPSVYKKIIRNQLLQLSNKADGWVFQTTGQQEWYGASNVRRSVIIPNAINLDFLHKTYTGERNDEIVTVGSFSVPKNHELLLSAFAKITSKHPLCKLIFYGKGPKEGKLREMARNLGVADLVVFAGYSTNVTESIRKSQLFVLSSDYEGIPNALMEAMALGLPCISTDCDGGGAKFLIKNEVNGLLVPKGDVNALAKAIEKMLSDRMFAEQCGREAHKICEWLAPERIYGEWEQFIKEVLKCD